MAALRTLLVIDDDPLDRRMVARLIGSGFVVREASNETSALDAVQSHPPSCILLDYRIPGTDTMALLSRLAAGRAPVVVLTGRGDETVAVEVMKRGAKDYLTKDHLSKMALTRTIQNAIEKTELESRFADQRRELEDFVSTVAHDLKSPLAAVKNQLEVLRDFYAERPLDRVGMDFVLTGIGTTSRMTRMIESLLEYCRWGRGARTFEAVDLAALLPAVQSSLRTVLSESGATLIIEPLPVVLGDEDALLLLFQNLIANALKFRTTAPMVRVEAVRQGEDWQISVADNGIGLDPQHAKKIFEPMCRLHTRQEYEGTGLGLATCQKIVDQHRGRIWVESAPGKGATFHFTLPAIEAGTPSNAGSSTLETHPAPISP